MQMNMVAWFLSLLHTLQSPTRYHCFTLTRVPTLWCSYPFAMLSLNYSTVPPPKPVHGRKSTVVSYGTGNPGVLIVFHWRLREDADAETLKWYQLSLVLLWNRKTGCSSSASSPWCWTSWRATSTLGDTNGFVLTDPLLSQTGDSKEYPLVFSQKARYRLENTAALLHLLRSAAAAEETKDISTACISCPSSIRVYMRSHIPPLLVM